MPTRWVEHGQRRRLGDLTPHPKNSRRHSPEQVQQIAAAMTAWDWTAPMIVDEGGVILAGHGRHMAGVAKFGEDYEVPVSVVHGWSDDEKRGYILADNRLTELGTWDDAILAGELRALDTAGFDLQLTGFDLADFAPRVGAGDPEVAPEPPKNPVSRLGDRWVCGDHVVRCGDSTSAADVGALLGDAKPVLMVTDPPYGVDYDPDWRNRADRANGKPYGARAIGIVKNDDRADWSEAWKLFPGAVAYVWHAPGALSAEVCRSLQECGFECRMQIIWVKSQLVIGRGNYHVQHEPCWYAVRKGSTAGWRGGRKQSTTWAIPKPHKSETGHGTQKPIEAMRRPIHNNSKGGDAVYDPFLGSGTTLIAAEIEDRRCYGMELDPAYVDVAVLRWQQFSGKTATLDGGKTFAEVAADRAKAARRTKANGKKRDAR